MARTSSRPKFVGPAIWGKSTRSWLFGARAGSLSVVSRGLLYISQHSRDVQTREGPRLLCYDLRADQ